jgi:hypothetical protein
LYQLQRRAGAGLGQGAEIFPRIVFPSLRGDFFGECWPLEKLCLAANLLFAAQGNFFVAIAYF